MGAPPISGVLHVSLSVADVERSKAFYSETLGLPVLRDVFEGEVFEGREVIVLAGLTGICLQEHRANPGDQFDPRRTGLDHIAFAVDDLDKLDAFASALTDAGVEHSRVKALTEYGHFIEFRDPDGVQVEIQCLA